MPDAVLNPVAARSMASRIAHALLLRGLGRYWPWPLTLALWVYIAQNAWPASPYAVVAIWGYPSAEQLTHYTGSVRRDNTLKRSLSGWAPPRYYVQTKDGEKEFFCGYLPKPRGCYYFLSGVDSTEDHTIIHHEYFGTGFVIFPASLNRPNSGPKRIQPIENFQRDLAEHLKYLKFFAALILVYASLSIASFVRSRSLNSIK